jgi:transcriptional regulator with XRE-family HTH domain
MTADSDIQGELLRLKREALGWTLADMAARACLSSKQVKQLEEGGDSAFYSLAIKLTVAKKLAQILGMTEDELFGRHLVNEETLELSGQTQLLAQEVLVQAELEQQMLTPSDAELGPTLASTELGKVVKVPSTLGASTSEIQLKNHAEVEVVTPDAAAEKKHVRTEAQDPTVNSIPHSVKVPQVSTMEQSSPLPVALSMPSNESSLSDSSDAKSSMGFGAKSLLFLLVLLGLVLIVEPKAKDDFVDLLKNAGFISNSNVESSITQDPVPVPLVEAPALESVEEGGKNPNALTTSPPSSAANPGTSPMALSKMPSPVPTPNAAPKSPDGPAMQNLSSAGAPSAKPTNLGSNSSSVNNVSANSNASVLSSPATLPSNTTNNLSSNQVPSQTKE